jgi:hypothetical protein
MTFQSLGKAFGWGFVSSLEQDGLLVHRRRVGRRAAAQAALPGPGRGSGAS